MKPRRTGTPDGRRGRGCGRERGLALALALALPGCTEPSTPKAAADENTPDDDDDDASTSSPQMPEPPGGSESGQVPGAKRFRLEFRELEVDGGLGMVTEHRFVPGTLQLLTLSKNGELGHFEIDGERANRLGGFTIDVHSELDCGLLSMAFAPDFARTRHLYLARCESMTHSSIVRVTFDAQDYDSIASSEVEIISLGDAAAPKPWHNVGQIGFDDAGALWALFGDKRLPAHGQATDSALAALVRIVPGAGGGYEPAAGNPFLETRDASPEVFAFGLRSPWRGTYDSFGRWWFGDVGANGFEEINVVTQPGQNFGWPRTEGPCEEDCDGLSEPVVWWPHDGPNRYAEDDADVSATSARVAWVGTEYTASHEDRYDGHLTGKLLFGDYCQGYVRALVLDAGGTIRVDEHLGHLAQPTAWNEAEDGYLYASTFGKCETAGLDEDDPPASRLVRAVMSQ